MPRPLSWPPFPFPDRRAPCVTAGRLKRGLFGVSLGGRAHSGPAALGAIVSPEIRETVTELTAI
jgi:hypothetical protein